MENIQIIKLTNALSFFRKFESLMSLFVSESELYSLSQSNGDSDSLVDGDLGCIQEEEEEEDNPIQMMTPSSPGNVR